MSANVAIGKVQMQETTRNTRLSEEKRIRYLNMVCRTLSFTILAMIVLLLCPSGVQAGDLYWTGAGEDYGPYWFYGMNWDTYNPPGSGDAA